MNDEKIKVRITESGDQLEVVVLRKRLDCIEVVLGTGVHSVTSRAIDKDGNIQPAKDDPLIANKVTCELTPTRTGAAYAGKVMGREIVYERSRDEVKADLDRANPALRKSRR